MCDFIEQRREVQVTAQKMAEDGLVVGTSGNVSLRRGELIAVTPSGIDYGEMTVEDIPIVDLDGTIISGTRMPTSELPMHLTAYREHGAGAVVHTHSLHATALSLLRDDVPAVHYQLADLGETVRVAKYATFGTAELAHNMSAAMSGSNACLLRNHGAITMGGDLAQAYSRARQLEWLCQLWLLATQAGSPHLLDAAEMARCAHAFASYGQPKG